MSSAWAQKRFWSKAGCVAAGGGFAVHLDARPLRTPAKAPLVVPTLKMARAIAGEWQDQPETINPNAMPVTRSANAAIDKVAPQRGEVADLVAAYGETDLLCYRAEGPAELRARQDGAWDPLLDWAADALGARLSPTVGVMYLRQEDRALAALKQRVVRLEPFALTAFHDLVGLSGSLVIGFAAIQQAMPIEELWRRSRIDALWQEEQWGEDALASQESAAKRRDFLHAQHFFELSNP